MPGLGGLAFCVALCALPTAFCGLNNGILTRAAKDEAAPKERQVGLFYFLWLGEHGRNPPRDVSRMLAEDPGLARRPDDPRWGPVGFYHHWGEPLYGYYYSDDEWVVRRHLKLIMQAGVDFLFFDTTNALIYEKNAKLVMRILHEYASDGRTTPKVMFYTNTKSGQTVEELLERIYRPGYASDTWYRLDGRPVVVAKEEECSEEARAFFTIVKSQWPNKPSKPGGWPWMDFERPQRLFPGERVARSVMNVSVAQHPQLSFGDSVLYGETGNRGRAYHDGHNDPDPGAWKRGLNFDEQWRRAYEADPDIVLVTGWNEWIMGRWQGFAERPIRFVDCANYEYSRDIEMMRGGYGDAYLEQLKAWVRRYKRLEDETPETPAGRVRRFRCFADDGMPRDAPGYGTNYVNRTQRNVPEWIEVSHDAERVRFVVKTRGPIDTSDRRGDFMRLLIEGRDAPGERSFDGALMTVSVPWREFGGVRAFGFKFVDSTVACADELDWYDHGVVEPLGRECFRYRPERR